MDQRHLEFGALKRLLLQHFADLQQHGIAQLPWAVPFFRDGIRELSDQVKRANNKKELGHAVNLAYYLAMHCNIWLPNEKRPVWAQFCTIAQLARGKQLETINWNKIKFASDSGI